MKYIVEEEVTVTRTYHVEADSPEEAQDIASELPANDAVGENWDYEMGDYSVVGVVTSEGGAQYGPVE